MSYEFTGFAPQGWQCPICKRVYAPGTLMCFYCGNEQRITSTKTSLNNDTIDWLHHDSVTKVDEQKLG